MWDRRFAPRTELPGVYLCGAATHPGGSVMGVNGRNAAAAVLADRDAPPAVAGLDHGSLRRIGDTPIRFLRA